MSEEKEEKPKEGEDKDVKKETQETKEVETKPDEATSTLVDDANLAAKRLEDANKVRADLLTREEALQAQNVLGGKAEAGAKIETEEEKAIASAKKMLEGTGLEDKAFPPN